MGVMREHVPGLIAKAMSITTQAGREAAQASIAYDLETVHGHSANVSKALALDLINDFSAPMVVLSKSADRVIYGPASVCIRDREGDLITGPALKAALPELLMRARFSLQHTDILPGEILGKFEKGGVVYKTEVRPVTKSDLEMFPKLKSAGVELGTDCLFVVGKIYASEDPESYVNKVWDKVQKGELNSFSVSGQARETSQKMDCAGFSCKMVKNISKVELSAVTLCKEGMNQAASFIILNKSMEQLIDSDFTGLTDTTTPQGNESITKALACAMCGKKARGNFAHEELDPTGGPPKVWCKDCWNIGKDCCDNCAEGKVCKSKETKEFPYKQVGPETSQESKSEQPKNPKQRQPLRGRQAAEKVAEGVGVIAGAATEAGKMPGRGVAHLLREGTPGTESGGAAKGAVYQSIGNIRGAMARRKGARMQKTHDKLDRIIYKSSPLGQLEGQLDSMLKANPVARQRDIRRGAQLADERKYPSYESGKTKRGSAAISRDVKRMERAERKAPEGEEDRARLVAAGRIRRREVDGKPKPFDPQAIGKQMDEILKADKYERTVAAREAWNESKDDVRRQGAAKRAAEKYGLSEDDTEHLTQAVRSGDRKVNRAAERAWKKGRGVTEYDKIARSDPVDVKKGRPGPDGRPSDALLKAQMTNGFRHEGSHKAGSKPDDCEACDEMYCGGCGELGGTNHGSCPGCGDFNKNKPGIFKAKGPGGRPSDAVEKPATHLGFSYGKPASTKHTSPDAGTLQKTHELLDSILKGGRSSDKDRTARKVDVQRGRELDPGPGGWDRWSVRDASERAIRYGKNPNRAAATARGRDVRAEEKKVQDLSAAQASGPVRKAHEALDKAVGKLCRCKGEGCVKCDWKGYVTKAAPLLAAAPAVAAGAARMAGGAALRSAAKGAKASSQENKAPPQEKGEAAAEQTVGDVEMKADKTRWADDCPKCHGHKEIGPERHPTRCPECDGSGKVKKSYKIHHRHHSPQMQSILLKLEVEGHDMVSAHRLAYSIGKANPMAREADRKRGAKDFPKVDQEADNPKTKLGRRMDRADEGVTSGRGKLLSEDEMHIHAPDVSVGRHQRQKNNKPKPFDPQAIGKQMDEMLKANPTAREEDKKRGTWKDHQGKREAPGQTDEGKVQTGRVVRSLNRDKQKPFDPQKLGKSISFEKEYNQNCPGCWEMMKTLDRPEIYFKVMEEALDTGILRDGMLKGRDYQLFKQELPLVQVMKAQKCIECGDEMDKKDIEQGEDGRTCIACSKNPGMQGPVS